MNSSSRFSEVFHTEILLEFLSEFLTKYSNSSLYDFTRILLQLLPCVLSCVFLAEYLLEFLPDFFLNTFWEKFWEKKMLEIAMAIHAKISGKKSENYKRKAENNITRILGWIAGEIPEGISKKKSAKMTEWVQTRITGVVSGKNVVKNLSSLDRIKTKNTMRNPKRFSLRNRWRPAKKSSECNAGYKAWKKSK